MSSLKKQLESVADDVNPKVTYDEIYNKRKKLHVKPPLKSVLCKTLHQENSISKSVLEENINSVYPIIHEDLLELMFQFINCKLSSGSLVEKSFYKDMTIPDFVTRLFLNRPLKFITSLDYYVLRNGKEGSGGFEKIGTDDEEKPLLLCDYLSYDEMKISALIGLSSYTQFINNGTRMNQGVVDKSGNFEKRGVIVGLVGARFEKVGLMEYQDCLVHPKQNTVENGYNNENSSEKTHQDQLKGLWARFYKIPSFPLYHTVSNSPRKEFEKIDHNKYFNKDVYQKRIKITAETLLIEANHRGKLSDKKVYVHVVGLGLGVWQLCDLQKELFLECFYSAITSLDLPFISNVDFSWFHVKTICGLSSGSIVPGTKISIHISTRNPADVLTGEHEGKLLVFCYAWDGNSYPGNEFWSGCFSGSGDPAAAASTQISEIHNPLINSKITGCNMRIVTQSHGLCTIKEYLNYL